MQGFARRYFTLQQSGWLSYSLEPGQLSRDQIFLPQAAISSTPGRRDIHIDSNKATFHIKCLSADDFNVWMAAFRRFIVREVPGAASLGRRSTLTRTTPRGGQYSRVGVLVNEIGNTITELQGAISALREEDAKRRSNSTRSGPGGDKKDRKDHVLGLFKKAAPTHSNHSASEVSIDTRSIDSSLSPGAGYERAQAILDALKNQHAALSKSIQPQSSIDSQSSVAHPGGLSTTAEEDGERTPTSPSRKLARSSMMSSNSGGSNSVWFDAPEGDGAEEYVVDHADASPGDESKGTLERKPSHVDSQVDTGSSAEASAETDVDTDADSELEDTSDKSEHADSAPTSPEPSTKEQKPIARRTQLPSPIVGDEGSLFQVLKKNVGKDLSQVAMPVSFNEPLTLLQKMAEELEYYELLSQAANAQDPVDRMCFVAAFAVSTYANTKYRTGRKGFNPMLAETFEDPRMKFISEKVSHNPVILAYHAEGEGWELWATSSGKTKFWGKSLEIIPQGTIHLKIGDQHYQWTRPSSFMRNLMMGTKYLEHCGKMVIENTTAGGRCTLDFKEGGYWGPVNMVAGTVVSASGETKTQLEGKWDEQMARKLDSSYLQVLWRMIPFPKNAPDYYGFTSFGITLNEVTPDLEGRLPLTDSRHRTDVRALEEGDLDSAEEEKKRIEEAQRERRRRGADRQPRWFKQVGDEWVYAGGYWEQRERGWKDVEALW